MIEFTHCHYGPKCWACRLEPELKKDHTWYDVCLAWKAVKGGRSVMPIKRPEGAPINVGAPASSRKGDDWVLYPSLCEFLSEDTYEDGGARKTGTLTIFLDGGGFKCSLNDRDLDRVAFLSSESITGLLVLLEDKLKASSIDWRESQGKGARRRR